MKKLPKDIFLIVCIFTHMIMCYSDTKASSLLDVEVNSTKTLNVDDFRSVILRAEKERKSWIKEPLLVAIEFIGTSHAKNQIIIQEYNRLENPDSVNIVIIQDGYLDDSLRGTKYSLVLSRNDKGIWDLVKAEIAFRCWPRRGHQNFSKDPCQ